MDELKDGIIEDVGLVLHNYFSGEDRQELFAWGDHPVANKLIDAIDEKIKGICRETETKLDAVEGSRDDLIDEKNYLENELKDRQQEVTDLEEQGEWDKMVKQFWYYCLTEGDRSHG